MEGALHCSNPDCLREFPIVDGIPLILTAIRQYVSDHIATLYARRDLGDFVESMLGDCCGPGSPFDLGRQHLSSYAWDHYADLDPKEKPGEPRPGSMIRNLDTGCELAGAFAPANSTAAGPLLDAGCSVGRGSFALAERSKGLVLGIDLNFAMLRVGSEILRHGTVRYPRRQVGLVYERREFPVRFINQENVDFWACDAAALPFPEETFAFASNLNVLDCVYSPRELLVSLARVLKPEGKMVLGCPYDWSPAATPLEGWLGGHSQRSPMAGSCETVLRTLLTPGAHPGSIPNLKMIAECENLPWHVRLHERSAMTYKVHLIAAAKAVKMVQN